MAVKKRRKKLRATREIKINMKIIQERSKCIGCGSCAAVCEKHFKMSEDGLASIIGGQMDNGNMILEVDDIACVREAVEICPVQIIKIE